MISSVISTGGPVLPLPFVPEGDDIGAQIEAHREPIPRPTCWPARREPGHFRRGDRLGPPPGNMEASDKPQASAALEFMPGYFARYIQERRIAPQPDVMTELAQAVFPDGSTRT